MMLARWPGRSFLILSLALLVSPLRADDTATVEQWLDRMARAVETLNYRGTLVHWRGDQLDTLKIIHRSDEQGVRERLYSLNGEPREILREGDQVRSLLAGDEPMVVQSQLTARLLPNLPLSRLRSAEQAYEMRVRGEERVAGLQTRIVEILPRDEFRYGHRFWLEQQTGMLLRSALLDQDGRAIQQLTFVEIEMGARISDLELEPELKPEVVLETRMEQNLPAVDHGELNRASWTPPRVPEHFRLARQGQGLAESGEVFEHLLYSDGLASFSIYIEGGASGYGGSRLESLGSVHVYTGSLNGRLITVVGEVPLATVQLVGRWLRMPPGAPRQR
ncbi:MAG: MucB/RseB C-terminal domain-containing protein [Pseudomonadota bacterium]